MAHLFHYLTGLVLRTSKLIIFLCTLTYICALHTSLFPFIIPAVLFVIRTNWKVSLNAQCLVYYMMRERWNIGCMSRLILLSNLLLGVLLDQWCKVHYNFCVCTWRCILLTFLHNSFLEGIPANPKRDHQWVKRKSTKATFCQLIFDSMPNSACIIRSTWLSVMERRFCCQWSYGTLVY